MKPALRAIVATLVMAAPSVATCALDTRSVFSMAITDANGNEQLVRSPETPPSATNNLLVQSITLPTDGMQVDETFTFVSPSSEDSEADETTTTGAAATAAAAPHFTRAQSPVRVMDVFDAPAEEPLPTPLYEANAAGVISVDTQITRTDTDEAINPFDPRGLRPLLTQETQITVATIIRGVRYAASINGSPAVKGSIIDSFVVHRIGADYVVLSHQGMYFKIPSGRTVTIRIPQQQ